MPSRSNVVESWMIHKAVYWSGAKSDGYGGRTFDEPVQIKVRWDDLQSISRSTDGSEVVSDASVRSMVPIDPGCWIWKGNIIDLNSGEAANPLFMDEAREVISCSAIYDLKGTMVYYRAVLGTSRRNVH